MSIDTRGLGVNETVRQLRELGEHVVEAAKMALKEGVDEVVADAKSRCPVKTGRLRDSIRAKSNRAGTVYELVADASVEDARGADGRFYYGAVVEFSPKINKPFMYPAMEAHRQPIRDKINEAISRAVGSG